MSTRRNGSSRTSSVVDESMYNSSFSRAISPSSLKSGDHSLKNVKPINNQSTLLVATQASINNCWNQSNDSYGNVYKYDIHDSRLCPRILRSHSSHAESSAGSWSNGWSRASSPSSKGSDTYVSQQTSSTRMTSTSRHTSPFSRYGSSRSSSPMNESKRSSRSGSPKAPVHISEHLLTPTLANIYSQQSYFDKRQNGLLNIKEDIWWEQRGSKQDIVNTNRDPYVHVPSKLMAPTVASNAFQTKRFEKNQAFHASLRLPKHIDADSRILKPTKSLNHMYSFKFAEEETKVNENVDTKKMYQPIISPRLTQPTVASSNSTWEAKEQMNALDALRIEEEKAAKMNGVKVAQPSDHLLTPTESFKYSKFKTNNDRLSVKANNNKVELRRNESQNFEKKNVTFLENDRANVKRNNDRNNDRSKSLTRYPTHGEIYPQTRQTNMIQNISIRNKRSGENASSVTPSQKSSAPWLNARKDKNVPANDDKSRQSLESRTSRHRKRNIMSLDKFGSLPGTERNSLSEDLQGKDSPKKDSNSIVRLKAMVSVKNLAKLFTGTSTASQTDSASGSLTTASLESVSNNLETRSKSNFQSKNQTEHSNHVTTLSTVNETLTGSDEANSSAIPRDVLKSRSLSEKSDGLRSIYSDSTATDHSIQSVKDNYDMTSNPRNNEPIHDSDVGVIIEEVVFEPSSTSKSDSTENVKLSEDITRDNKSTDIDTDVNNIKISNQEDMNMMEDVMMIDENELMYDGDYDYSESESYMNSDFATSEIN